MHNNDYSTPTDHITAIRMNGLRGRMLRLSAPRGKKRELLVIFGQRGSLERWWPLARQLNKYGTVTMPDMPGLGGMQSFYKLGQSPTLDDYADYLAAFMKLKYAHKRVTVVAISFGFSVVTRMLQRYPKVTQQVDAVVALDGYIHHEDLRWPLWRRKLRTYSARAMSLPFPALVFRNICLFPPLLTRYYQRKTSASAVNDKERFIKQQITTWRVNDTRTYWKVNAIQMGLQNYRAPLTVPLWNVQLADHAVLNPERTAQHMRVAYQTVHEATAKASYQQFCDPSSNTADQLLPVAVKRALGRS